MSRILTVSVMALPILVGCLLVPLQYDHAMLREYFGKSPEEVAGFFGKPLSITQADPQSPPESATVEEQEEFNLDTESMTYAYTTVDGELVFHFNLENSDSAGVCDGQVRK